MYRTLLFGLISLSVTVFGCRSQEAAVSTDLDSSVQSPAEPLDYRVNLHDRDDDTFDVILRVDDLSEENDVYHFASTAPGTYQVMDIGRFVVRFEAFDDEGNSIPVEQTSTNQWTISAPEDVVEIRYELQETWDTPVDEHPIYLMAGTSLEDDHTLINGQAVFGYPEGMQSRPLVIDIEAPDSWMIGTALMKDDSGRFVAEDYDHIVDSPLLLGRLTHASLNVRGSIIDIYSYSKTDKVHAEEILEAVDHILEAAGDFLNGLPVDRYAFLFHFEDVSMGAWEHSYSSEYVLAEAAFEQQIESLIPDVVAHEFFHIVTPLNIHSEIIEEFNFVEPVPSRHLWLYEGVTEWASDAMQLRTGLITPEEYLDRISHKLTSNDGFDRTYSLEKLALTSFTEEGVQQYPNIYQRGAVVAALLNLRLLQLSDGELDLRDVLLELSKRYGPEKAFSDEGFYDTFAEMTYPEIRDFLRKYVQSSEPLPVADYFAAVGVEYEPSMATGEKTLSSGYQVTFNGKSFAVASVEEVGAECGLRDGDLLTHLLGEKLTLANVQQVLPRYQALGEGEAYELTVLRDGASVEITCAKQEVDEIEKHVLTLEEDVPADVKELRSAWLGRKSQSGG